MSRRTFGTHHVARSAAALLAEAAGVERRDALDVLWHRCCADWLVEDLPAPVLPFGVDLGVNLDDLDADVEP